MFRLIVALSLICICSALEDRIVNGKSANINEFPYQVSIQEDEEHFCGGSIINEKLILTAAHCFEGTESSKVKNMQVRAGSSQWASGGVLKKIEAWYMHPDWNPETMVNDICIVVLQSSFVPSASIRKIPLATVTPKDGDKVVVTGWGTTIEGGQKYPNLLQKTELSFLTTESCASEKFKYTKANVMGPMVCAVGAGTDSCQGDSGGPLNHDGELVGVVSWGEGCARKGFPGVYANVPTFIPWINIMEKSLLKIK